MQKDDLNGHILQNRNWCSLISDWLFFSLTLTVRDSFIGRILSEKKKLGGSGLLSEKMEAMHSELNKTVEAPTSSYSAAIDFFKIYLFSACG